MPRPDEPRDSRPRRTPAVRAPRHAAGDRPEAVDGPYAVERMTALTHDLGNLLDGSMRCLGLARRALERRGREAAAAGSDRIDAARRQLDTVYGAMERMADLVQAAMRGSASVVASPTLTPRRPITLGEALRHAASVIGPRAAELRVRVDVSMSPDAGELPVGPLYTVVLNGLRNALESIERLPEPVRSAGGAGAGGGQVEARATIRAMPGASPAAPGDGPGIVRHFVVIEILDDGLGIRTPAEGARAFDIGYTSKPGGIGVGLALAREVVRELVGTIELLPRRDLSQPERPGAVLRVTYPWPTPRPPGPGSPPAGTGPGRA